MNIECAAVYEHLGYGILPLNIVKHTIIEDVFGP